VTDSLPAREKASPSAGGGGARSKTSQARDGPRWLRRAVGPGHRLAGLVVVAALLAVGALAGVALAAGLSAVERVMLHPQWAWLFAAVAGEVAAYVGYTLAYRETIAVAGGAELEAPKAAALVAVGFGVFLEGGGFALDREALERSGLSDRESRRRVLVLGVLEYAVLGPVTAIAALIVFLRAGDVSSSLTLPWLIGVPAGAALAFGALRLRKRLEGTRGWRARLGHGLAALDLILSMLRSPRQSWLAFVGITAYWAGLLYRRFNSCALRRREGIERLISPPEQAGLVPGELRDRVRPSGVVHECFAEPCLICSLF
jgi:hypothetical protein